MAVVTYAATTLLSGRLPVNALGTLTTVSLAGGAGTIAYSAILLASKLPEATTLAQTIRARLPLQRK